MSLKPCLAISMGDPAGIGPEIIVKALGAIKKPYSFRPLIIGERKIFDRAVKICHSRLKVIPVNGIPAAAWTGQTLPVWTPRPAPLEFKPGQWTAKSGEVSFLAVKHAAGLAIKKSVAALVTAPISKEAWRAAGIRFSGHTELLAQLTRSRNYAMMFVNGPFRVVLITIHEPLSRVPKLITREKIIQTITVAAEELRRRFGIRKPRIAVAGLNPHAGEGGLFGQEEQTVIRPALRELKKQTRWQLTGPYPPDTLFLEAQQGVYDLVVCMYHDQGLIPFKMLALHQGVNLTAGLPIIRTSPDHGTAFNLAGTGKAQAGSMLAAIQIALTMIRHSASRGSA